MQHFILKTYLLVQRTSHPDISYPEIQVMRKLSINRNQKGAAPYRRNRYIVLNIPAFQDNFRPFNPAYLFETPAYIIYLLICKRNPNHLVCFYVLNQFLRHRKINRLIAVLIHNGHVREKHIILHDVL